MSSSSVPRIARVSSADAVSRDTMMPPNVVAGKPTWLLESCYEDSSKAFSCGVWNCEPGKWNFEQPFGEEFCVMIEGEAIITLAADGSSETFKKGDAFVIPAGFVGSWETVSKISKFYAYLDKTPAAQQTPPVVAAQQAQPKL